MSILSFYNDLPKTRGKSSAPVITVPDNCAARTQPERRSGSSRSHCSRNQVAKISVFRNFRYRVAEYLKVPL
ncbi:hypothetical protein Y032_0401g798 [Ancylostoma ceylanicum]|uniref:Uncharacterized protein n=1 Tax=Ancylostoma ceylanicum TaxID=53326 RepID=A0A016X3C3_9BILA|nr:hypothetical protein Y032_0401g798 [Ancylostoma ceylanicum]